MNINSSIDTKENNKIKVLNLYAGLGGNRTLWTNCDVTAVEINPILTDLYSQRFPFDKVIVADAHEYLLNNFQDYDFIWSSPPCQTHSKARSIGVPKYPDLKLYEEIIFLQKYCKKYFLVENVEPYYKPLLPYQKRGRHLFWSNFHIPYFKTESVNFGNIKNEYQKLCQYHNYILPHKIGIKNRVQILRNMVHYNTGNEIFCFLQNILNSNSPVQIDLFS